MRCKEEEKGESRKEKVSQGWADYFVVIQWGDHLVYPIFCGEVDHDVGKQFIPRYISRYISLKILISFGHIIALLHAYGTPVSAWTSRSSSLPGWLSAAGKP